MPSLPKSIAISHLCPKDPTLEASAGSACQVCLDLECKAETGQQLIYARVLGYLILHAPSAQALSETTSFVHVRSSFDKNKEKWMAEIKEAPKDHREAKRQALIRDGFQCVVTGLYDNSAFDESASGRIDQEAIRDVKISVNTECTHIVPESTYFNTSNTPAEKDYPASLLAVLKRFGYDVDNLNGAKVHSLYNVMTTEYDVHDWFDSLNLWFEATPVVHCYHVKTDSGRFPHPMAPTEITFAPSERPELPLPSPELLALHAACAKVAHLSGAGAYLDELDRDMEDLCVLANDGGSFSILNNALLRSLPSINVGT
ncbi:hypothetical protein PQX77_008856 [Marasmius sp. AFHP31]|nr:hypothetical protein PQX77_008856 [Marasmius sp. AFHP31]